MKGSHTRAAKLKFKFSKFLQSSLWTSWGLMLDSVIGCLHLECLMCLKSETQYWELPMCNPYFCSSHDFERKPQEITDLQIYILGISTSMTTQMTTPLRRSSLGATDTCEVSCSAEEKQIQCVLQRLPASMRFTFSASAASCYIASVLSSNIIDVTYSCSLGQKRPR